MTTLSAPLLPTPVDLTRSTELRRLLGSLPCLADLSDDLVVVDGGVRAHEVDRMFRLDPQLQAVGVTTASGVAMLTREHVSRLLDGRLGYGRALHTRATAATIVPAQPFWLPGTMNVLDAAERVLHRPEGHQYQHVLVVHEERSSAVAVTRIFESLASVYRHLAFHDPLTGLSNRRMLEVAAAELVAAGVDPSRVALLYVDLDGFKGVNDTFGHRAGDEVLTSFGERLRSCVRPTDHVARLGGDEFVAVLVDVTPLQARAVAERVVLTASAPFVVDGDLIEISASVGLTMASEAGRESELAAVDVLLRHADTAMLQAKANGKRRVTELAPGDGANPRVRESQLRRRLAAAPDNGSMRLHFQPKLDLATGTASSVEALLRWDDAELGPVSPAEFIPLAESGGDIHRIGRWVLREAAAQVRRWDDAGTPRTVAVNVSPRQLSAGSLVDDLLQAAEAAGVAPDRLQVELTEGSAILDVPTAIDQLRRLRDLGVRIDLDDFGTGYASLALLHQLPLTAVKIDKEFVDRIDTSLAEAQMLQGVISAAHAIGLTVVAEGIEREAQLSLLEELGCDEAQGYFIGRPAPADQIA